jgi:hypothetical protein
VRQLRSAIVRRFSPGHIATAKKPREGTS